MSFPASPPGFGLTSKGSFFPSHLLLSFLVGVMAPFCALARFSGSESPSTSFIFASKCPFSLFFFYLLSSLCVPHPRLFRPSVLVCINSRFWSVSFLFFPRRFTGLVRIGFPARREIFGNALVRISRTSTTTSISSPSRFLSLSSFLAQFRFPSLSLSQCFFFFFPALVSPPPVYICAAWPPFLSLESFDHPQIFHPDSRSSTEPRFFPFELFDWLFRYCVSYPAHARFTYL